jgi:hypothetical protein
MGELIHLSSQEIKESLEIARELISHGIPVFSAPPCPAAHGGTCHIAGHGAGKTPFHLPREWQKTVPAPVWLERWEPGHALGMVGGHLADVLDVDPRHGGDASARELRRAGDWPRTFGRQTTPSGGEHFVISPTGERETNGFMPGLDLQSGAAAPDAHGTHGRGFAYLAPTVKPSKVTGEPAPYRWLEAPDLALLADFAGSDDSIEGVRTRIAAHRARRSAPPAPGDSPFVTASAATSQLFAGPGRADAGERVFTPEEARAYTAPVLERLRAARIGEIEERCNAAAVQLAHFVPAFLTVDGAMKVLRDALSTTPYDEHHPASAWTVEKFRPVLDGRRPPADGWKASARESTELEGLLTPQVSTAAAPPADAVEALLAEMLTLDQVKERPAPRPLIKGLLNLDSAAWLIGAPGCRKSFVALDMACHVAAGRPWQGLKVTQGPVVIVAAEGAGGLGKRIKAWEVVHGPLPAGVHVLPRPVQAGDRAAWAVLVEACRRLAPVLVVGDTQARLSVGLDENDATDMGHFIEAVDAVKRATGACVMPIHHTGRKGGDARGSSAIDGAQDTELKVEKGEGLRGRLLVEKQKDLDERPALELAFVSVVVGADEDGEPITSLALASDPFVIAAAATGPVDERALSAREADRRLAVLLQQAEPWETGYSGHQVHLIKVLLYIGGTTGLTKAEARHNLIETFGPIARKSFDGAWDKVLSLRSAREEPLAVNVRGEKWMIDADALESLKPGQTTRGDIRRTSVADIVS